MHQRTRTLTPPCIDSLLVPSRMWSMLGQISTSRSALSQFMVALKRVHMIAARHILRYLRGTIEYGLRYT